MSNRLPETLQLTAQAKELAKGRLLIGLTIWCTVLPAAFAGFTWLESWRYFPTSVRLVLDLILVIAGLGSLVLLTGYYFMLKSQRLPAAQPLRLARAVIHTRNSARDTILNAVQLVEQSESFARLGISSTLTTAAVARGAKIAATLPVDLLYPTEMQYRWNRRFLLVLIPVLIVYALNFSAMNTAALRLWQPRTVFPYPVPVDLALDANQSEFLAGDTVLIAGQLRGRHFDQVSLIQTDKEGERQFTVPVKHHVFRLNLPHVSRSFSILGQVKNKRFWEPWRNQKSNLLNITVINRPVVQQLTVKIRPPAYTKLPVSVHSRDILEINALRGSKIGLNGLASKPVTQAIAVFQSGDSLPLQVSGQQFQGAFTLKGNDTFWLQVVDDEGVSNLNPLKYPVYAGADAPPLAKVLVPARDVLLNEALQLPLRVKLDDDFGFSRLSLNYQIRHPDYLQPDTTRYSETIKLPRVHEKTLEAAYNWALSGLNLNPEDGVDYWFTVWDNDRITGPKSTRTRIWSARLPSLVEMFQAVNQANDQVKSQTEDVLEAVKSIKEKVDELALEVTKNPQMSWEQQQEAKQTITETETLQQQLNDISEKLDQMIKASREQDLFDQETLDKYSELQNLFQELLTPELKAAMEKLRQAMDANDPRQIQNAMQDFQASMENFKQSVERTLEIFKRVQIEQKLDELSKRLTDLANRQQELVQDLKSNDPARTQTDAIKEQKISDEYRAAEKTARDLNALLRDQQEVDPRPASEFQQAMQASQTDTNLEQALSMLKQNQVLQSRTPAQQARQSLQQLAQQALKMQQALQQQMMSEVLSAFRNIMLKTLGLSQMQEDLENQTRDIPRHSSRIRDRADQQMALTEGLKKIAADLNALSNQTFAVGPKLGQALGRSQSQMQSAIARMENRSPAQAAKAQARAREALNLAAEQLSSAMQNLQQGGQSSGFDQYMRQLQNMAGQQQGLNQQTQLGLGNMSVMQQLAERQMALRQNLQQIQQGVGNDPRMMGDLGKIGQEMEAVAKSMRRKNPRRDLIEKQRRILSRLLDAQRSAHERDYSKQRTSKTGENKPFWTGPNGLPSDLGEARNILYEELLYSLKQPYSREDQALIRAYFETLSDEINQPVREIPK